MYAVIETGGKQYRVQSGDIVEVEKLEGEIGTAVKFNQILFAAKPSGETSQVWLGKPYLAGATVETEIVGQGRGEKVMIVKMKRRKQYRRTQGHRQFQTQLLVTLVDNGAGEKAVLAAEAKKATLDKFHSYLKEKGPAHTAPIIGSRKRLANAARGAHAEVKATSKTEGAEGAKKKAPAKKAPAKKKAD